MIPISVCIIAKNEEEKIEKCLRTLYKHPFEIIVVDTGSTDDTKQIASKYADKILDFPWNNDFSAARNFSIKAASHDMILIIDCDEYVQDLDFTMLQNLITVHPEDIGTLTRYQVSSNGSKHTTPICEQTERLFNRQFYHYEGAAHEQLVRTDGSPTSSYEIPITLSHLGSNENHFANSISSLQTSLKRNPQDPFLYYKLGAAYMEEASYEKAFEYLNKGLCFPLDKTQEYVQKMVILYGQCLLQTNRYEKALMLANVYDDFSGIADYLFLMGQIYMHARIPDKALMEFLKATTVKKHFEEGTNSFLAFHNIGCIYEANGQIEKAKEYFRKAGKYPESVERLKEL